MLALPSLIGKLLKFRGFAGIFLIFGLILFYFLVETKADIFPTLRCVRRHAKYALDRRKLTKILTSKNLGRYRSQGGRKSAMGRVMFLETKWTRPFWGTDCWRAPKASPRPRQPPFAAPALRARKRFAGLAFFEMLSQYPQAAFQGLCEDH